MRSQKLKLGIPKGSLQEYTLKTFKRAGFDIEIPQRGYFLKIDDPEIECYLLRPQEIPKYVEKGKLDLGISGDDWILETNSEVAKVCDLKYAKRIIKKVKWVLAVPKNSKIKKIQDLEGKVIATEAKNIVKNYLKKNKVKAKVEFSFGATEVKPPRFADAICDITETGASLLAHNLRVLDTVLISSTKLIANKKAFLKDKWKKKKIKNISLLLLGAVRGEEEVNLMMNVSGGKLRKILRILPKTKLTIRKIAGQDWYDVLFSCKKLETRKLIPKLKRLGCQGIVEFPINKIIR